MPYCRIKLSFIIRRIRGRFPNSPYTYLTYILRNAPNWDRRNDVNVI
jgi:hypothetical protein